jgi:diguanylate cyclase
LSAALRERRLHDLRNAISRGELRLVYQPEKNIRTDEVVGFEALLRWKHPTRGDVSSAEFIPIAEDTGLILQIGEWVLRTACREEAATWTQPLTNAVYDRCCGLQKGKGTPDGTGYVRTDTVQNRQVLAAAN